MALLFIKTKYVSDMETSEAPELKGEKASDVASLDYAISKLPAWIKRMFGTDKEERPLAPALFKRHNSGRYYPGPVKVRLNESRISPSDIELYLDGKKVNNFWQYDRLQLSRQFFRLSYGVRLSDSAQ